MRWIIETFEPTGEFHELSGGHKLPKHRVICEPISDDLEAALSALYERYPFEAFRITTMRLDGEPIFHVTDLTSEYGLNCAAVMKAVSVA